MDDNEAAEVAKALSHPMRLGYLRALRKARKLSPIEYSRESGIPLGNVSYHVKALAKAGVVEIVQTLPRRGTMEHRYQLKQPRAKLVFRLMDLPAKS